MGEEGIFDNLSPSERNPVYLPITYLCDPSLPNLCDIIKNVSRISLVVQIVKSVGDTLQIFIVSTLHTQTPLCLHFIIAVDYQ